MKRTILSFCLMLAIISATASSSDNSPPNCTIQDLGKFIYITHRHDNNGGSAWHKKIINKSDIVTIISDIRSINIALKVPGEVDTDFYWVPITFRDISDVTLFFDLLAGTLKENDNKGVERTR